MKKRTGSIFFVVFVFSVLVSCKGINKKKEMQWLKEIINTDENFSAQSQRLGMKKSFIEFMDDNGILLRKNHLPIVGADAIDYLSQTNDSNFTLTWKPLSASVSSSGDLGFSYGTYSLKLADTSLYGTYVSIWKKQEDGKWKFILDSGNEGISSPGE